MKQFYRLAAISLAAVLTLSNVNTVFAAEASEPTPPQQSELTVSEISADIPDGKKTSPEENKKGDLTLKGEADAPASQPEAPQRLKTPVLNSVSNTEDGIRIEWQPVTSAAKYRIFYRIGSGKWQSLADTAQTSYVWNQAVPLTTYSFTVACLGSNSEQISDYDPSGKSVKYILTAPAITKVANVTGGLKITWKKVNGAAGYRVFYKSGSKLKKIGDTSSTSYTWKKGKVGTSYTFVVRCITKNGASYTSDYDNAGKKGLFYKYATPAISSVKNTASGIRIKWKKISKVSYYRIYYKRSKNASWKKLADTTSTSYTLKNAKAGGTYYFSVRCLSSNKKAYVSNYDRTGKKIIFLSRPKISKITATDSGVNISWKKIKGASSYQIYRYTKNGWKKIAESTSPSCTVDAAFNKTYRYSVRARKNEFASSLDSTGKKFRRLPTPKAPTVKAGRSSVTIKWKKVNGAEKYRILYRKKNGGSWKKIGDTTSTSYTWKNYKPMTKYYICVRCLSKDGKSYTSYYDPNGTAVTTKRYQNPSKYYQIKDSIKLSGGGYTVSRGYEGLKVAWIAKKLKVRRSNVGMGVGKCVYTGSVERAVKRFQRKKHLPATGKVNLATWKAMGYSEKQWYTLGAYVSPVKTNSKSSRSDHIEAMISRAYDYLGTNYIVGSSGPPGTGVDCSGLVMQALYAGGLDISPISPVRHAKPGYEYESRYMWASSKFKHVSYSQRQRGDLIFYHKNGVVIHVAIYLGHNRVIECWPNKVVIWPIRNSHRSNIKGVVRPFV